MKRNGLMPRVSREPDVEAADAMNRLAQMLGYDDYQAQIETGISEETVIVHGALPASYLRVHREPMLRKLPVPDGGPAFSR